MPKINFEIVFLTQNNLFRGKPWGYGLYVEKINP